MFKLKTTMLRAVVAAALAAGTLGAVATSPALAAGGTNPSTACSATGNGGVSHGGCTSTAARYGSADLENLPVLSTAALQSNCRLIQQQFLQMAASIPPDAYSFIIPGQTFANSTDLGNYIFHDIFGPDPSTCAVVLAADHATITSPSGPSDVYYTRGHGGNTTYQLGVPADLVFLFGS